MPNVPMLTIGTAGDSTYYQHSLPNSAQHGYFSFISETVVKFERAAEIESSDHLGAAYIAIALPSKKALFFNGDTSYWRCGGWTA